MGNFKSEQGIQIFRYFMVLLFLSIPFWIGSRYLNIDGLPDNLPITDVGATFMPMVAAIICVHLERGRDGVIELLKRIVDYKKIKLKWFVPIIFLMPSLYVLSYLIMIALGMDFPSPYRIEISAVFLFIAFYLAAIGEETGYMGYAIDKMQDAMNPVSSGLIMGSFWALWHLPSMIAINQKAALIIIGLLATIGFRIIYIWIFNNTNGSVAGVVLMHAIGNTGRTLFPGGRSYYEKMNGFVGYTLIIITAILIMVLAKDMKGAGNGTGNCQKTR